MYNHLLRCCLCGYLGFCLLALLVPAESHACPVAHQTRLIPLGTLKGQLKVLEFVMRRDRAPERLQKKKVWVWWEGKAWLRTVDQQGRLLPAKTFASKVTLLEEGKRYKAGLRKVVRLVRRKFKIQNNIKRVEMDFCTYKKKCRGVAIRRLGKKLLALIHKNGKRLVTLDRSYLASLVEPNSFELSARNRLVMVYMVRTRRNRRFAIVQVSEGGLGGVWRTTSPMKRRVCRKSLDCMPPPLVLHHGKTIDVIVRW